MRGLVIAQQALTPNGIGGPKDENRNNVHPRLSNRIVPTPVTGLVGQIDLFHVDRTRQGQDVGIYVGHHLIRQDRRLIRRHLVGRPAQLLEESVERQLGFRQSWPRAAATMADVAVALVAAIHFEELLTPFGVAGRGGGLGRGCNPEPWRRRNGH